MLRGSVKRSCAAMGPLFLILLTPAVSRAEENLYQLIGNVRQENGKSLHGTHPVVLLFSNTTPFSVQALVDVGGHFKIKDVPPGPYTVAIAIPHTGEWTQSVDIGPSFADEKGRVVKDFPLHLASPISNSHAISATQLSVPYKALAEYRRAQDCLGKYDSEGAVKHLKKAVAIAPQFSGAWNSLGTISYQLKKLDEAEEFFREALKQDPSAHSPLVNLAGTLLSRGQFDEALTLNKLAVQNWPDDALAQSQLGQTYFRMGQLDLAEHHLQLARSLDASHFTYPQLVLADIYQRRRDFPSLVRELEEFLRLHPDSKRVNDVRRLLIYARSRANSK